MVTRRGVKLNENHQYGLGDLLTDDNTELSKIGSTDLADVKEAVC